MMGLQESEYISVAKEEDTFRAEAGEETRSTGALDHESLFT